MKYLYIIPKQNTEGGLLCTNVLMKSPVRSPVLQIGKQLFRWTWTGSNEKVTQENGASWLSAQSVKGMVLNEEQYVQWLREVGLRSMYPGSLMDEKLSFSVWGDKADAVLSDISQVSIGFFSLKESYFFEMEKNYFANQPYLPFANGHRVVIPRNPLLDEKYDPSKSPFKIIESGVGPVFDSGDQESRAHNFTAMINWGISGNHSIIGIPNSSVILMHKDFIDMVNKKFDVAGKFYVEDSEYAKLSYISTKK